MERMIITTFIFKYNDNNVIEFLNFTIEFPISKNKDIYWWKLRHLDGKENGLISFYHEMGRKTLKTYKIKVKLITRVGILFHSKTSRVMLSLRQTDPDITTDLIWKGYFVVRVEGEVCISLLISAAFNLKIHAEMNQSLSHRTN